MRRRWLAEFELLDATESKLSPEMTRNFATNLPQQKFHYCLSLIEVEVEVIAKVRPQLLRSSSSSSANCKWDEGKRYSELRSWTR